MANPIEERFAEVLLERIRNDQYPSTTHMSMLEATASDRVLAEYILHLMERIEAEQHPSTSMMQRVQRLAAQYGG
ncbi:MAG TPA: hypothetical protein VFX80_03055 [Solirubrobacteraceae bacterium]|nr:hypothetical protein [Solirubrobacteraceae bacterium]